MLDGGWFRPVQLAEVGVSMIAIDECTRRDDGYIVPDIPLPAIAAEYLSGRDGELDRLLAIICERRDRNTRNAECETGLRQ